MPKPKKAASTPARPTKVRGYLSCKDCSMRLEFPSYGNGPSDDGGWPQHRCGFNIRPFTRWTSDVTPPPLTTEPPSPLEGPDHDTA